MSRIVLALVVVGCGGKGVDPDKAALFTEIVIDTVPGLSGMAIDPAGGIWTVAERDGKAYRITLDASLRPTLETFTVEGVPDGIDLEGMAWLGEGHLALGTEGRDHGAAAVLLADRRDTRLVVVGTIEIPESRLGLQIAANHGAEGICAAGNEILASIEEVGKQDGKRWAPIIQIENGLITHVHKLWLTTETGKLSALDCQLRDGEIRAITIERHFEVTKILTFTVPAADGDITPHVALDLGKVLHGTLNLEGIAWTASGGVIAVNDNQYGKITGPSELLVFKPGVIK